MSTSLTITLTATTNPMDAERFKMSVGFRLYCKCPLLWTEAPTWTVQHLVINGDEHQGVCANLCGHFHKIR